MSKKYKIGVYGSSAGDIAKIIPLAAEIGRQLGRYSEAVIVITGACSGLPYAAAKAASDLDTEVWGYSSSLDLDALKVEYPDDDVTIYKKLIYVPPEFTFSGRDLIRKKYRNIISTANCDAGILISGRWGTLNEFTNLIDFGKPVGVLTGTGGVADELPGLTKKVSKAGQGKIIFESDPVRLVDRLLKDLKATKRL